MDDPMVRRYVAKGSFLIDIHGDIATNLGGG